jgi:hypothetical protein
MPPKITRLGAKGILKKNKGGKRYNTISIGCDVRMFVTSRKLILHGLGNPGLLTYFGNKIGKTMSLHRGLVGSDVKWGRDSY